MASAALQERAPGRVRWTPVAALAAGACAIGTDLFVVAGVLGGLAGDLGVSVGAAGVAIAVPGLASAVGGPLLGAALGGRPLRPLLVGSLAVVGVAALASAAAPTFALLLAARALGALAASVYVPAAGAAAVAAVPESARGRALGGVLVGTSVAMVLGAPLGVLLAGVLSWRAAFGLAAVLAVAGVAALLVSDVGSGRLTPSTLAERLAPVRHPAVLAALGVTLLVMTASNSVFSYLGVLVGDAGVGPAMAAFGLGGLAGAWWGGSAADRRGHRGVVAVTAFVLAGALASLPGATAARGLLLAVVAGWGGAVWAFTAAQQHRLSGLGPGPLFLALNSAAIHLGFAAGALLGGIVVDAAGTGPLPVLAVACCGAGLTLHTVSSREVRP